MSLSLSPAPAQGYSLRPEERQEIHVGERVVVVEVVPKDQTAAQHPQDRGGTQRHAGLLVICRCLFIYSFIIVVVFVIV